VNITQVLLKSCNEKKECKEFFPHTPYLLN